MKPLLILLFAAGCGSEAIPLVPSTASSELPIAPSFLLSGSAINEEFGFSVTAIKSITGEGGPDFAIGAPGSSGDRGKVYIYRDGANDLENPFVLEGLAQDDRFGEQMASGDFNGDGRSDLVVASHRSEVQTSEANASKVYIYWGTSSGYALSADMVYRSGENKFGQALAAADFTGDGIDDLLIGDWYPYPYVSRGEVHLYTGSLAGLSEQSDVVFTGSYLDVDNFGVRISILPDYDGDGDDEFAICYITGCSVFLGGSPPSLNPVQLYSAPPGVPYTIGPLNDVNNDGYRELLRTSNQYAYIHFGQANGFSPQPNQSITFSDTLVKTLLIDWNGDQQHEVFLANRDTLQRYPDITTPVSTLSLEWPSYADFFEPALDMSGRQYPAPATSLGDINQDGTEDVLVGVPNANNRGEAYIFFGGAEDLDDDGFLSTTDCNDTNPEIFPGAEEICGNGEDDDCDDSTSDVCPTPDTGEETGIDSGSLETGLDTADETGVPDVDTSDTEPPDTGEETGVDSGSLETGLDTGDETGNPDVDTSDTEPPDSANPDTSEDTDPERLIPLIVEGCQCGHATPGGAAALFGVLGYFIRRRRT